MTGRSWMLGIAVVVSACAGASRAGNDSSGSAGAIVIRNADMRPGILLESIKPRLPMMTTSERAGQCPGLTFRGARSINAADTPSIYVDGTLMTNTCSLIELTAADVDFVEVYTSGAAGRAGVQRNPAGVILIFRRRR